MDRWGGKGNGQKAYHPFMEIRNKKVKEPNQRLECCMEYLKEYDLRCKKFSSKKNQNPYYECNCLGFLKDKMDDTGAVVESREFQRECVASSMCTFNDKPLQERQSNIMTMIQYTDGVTENKKFILPFVDVNADPVTNTNDDQNGHRPEIAMLCGRKVCCSAIAALLDFSFRKWKT